MKHVLMGLLISVTGCGIYVTETDDEGYENSDRRNEFALMFDDERELQITSENLRCMRRDEAFTISYFDEAGVADGVRFSMVMVGEPSDGLALTTDYQRESRFFQVTTSFEDGQTYVMDRYTIAEQPRMYAALTFTEVNSFKVAGRLWIEDISPVGAPARAMGLRASFTCVRFQ